MGALVSPLTIVGLCALLVTVVLQIVGLATTYWISVSNHGHSGLFETCSDEGQCYSIDTTSRISGFGTPSWLKSVRALEIMSVIAAGGVFLLLVVFVLKQKNGQPQGKALCYLMAATCIGASGCSLVGCLIYWLKTINMDIYLLDDDASIDMDYSFFLCFAAGVLFVVDGALLLVGTSKQVNEATVANPGGQVIQSQAAYQVHYQGPRPQHIQQHGQAMNVYPPNQPGAYPASQPGMHLTNQPVMYPGGQPQAPIPDQPALYPQMASGQEVKGSF